VVLAGATNLPSRWGILDSIVRNAARPMICPMEPLPGGVLPLDVTPSTLLLLGNVNGAQYCKVIKPRDKIVDAGRGGEIIGVYYLVCCKIF